MPIDFSFLLRKHPFDTFWLQNWKVWLVLFCFDLVSLKGNDPWILLGMEFHVKRDVPINYLALKVIGIPDTWLIRRFQGGFTLCFPPSFRRARITKGQEVVIINFTVFLRSILFSFLLKENKAHENDPRIDAIHIFIIIITFHEGDTYLSIYLYNHRYVSLCYS